MCNCRERATSGLVFSILTDVVPSRKHPAVTPVDIFAAIAPIEQRDGVVAAVAVADVRLWMMLLRQTTFGNLEIR